MTTGDTQAVRDRKLWLRILLVGSTGSLPLFVVALLLINAAYSRDIDFGLREQRGNAFLRPLARLSEVLPDYQAAARRSLVGSAADTGELAKAAQEIDVALAAVALTYKGELGRELRFIDSAQLPGSRADARLSVFQSEWEQLKRAPLSVAASVQATVPLLDSVRAMTHDVGDRSNLILDDELDSYYLMDITLSALPETQQRLAEITLRVSDWLRTEQPQVHQTQIAVMAATLRQADLARIRSDAQISLSEDARFNGVSASLHAQLPPAVARLDAACERLLVLLDRISTGEAVPAGEFEAAGFGARAESFRLLRVAADELDRLLAARVRAIEARRLGGYSIIVGTLGLAAGIMGLIMRGLLASRYAEILKTQEELRSKETQLRALGDNLPGGMTYQIMRDFDGTMRFLYVSAGIERLNGVSADAALADSARLYQLISPEDMPALRAAERSSLSNKSPFNVVVRMTRPDGVKRWMEFSSAPRFLPDGRAVWDGIQMDVTDRHEAEAITRQSELRFSRIFDNSPIPITLSGLADGKFIAANDRFLKVTGFARENVIDHTSLELGMYRDSSERDFVMGQLALHGHLHAHEQHFRTLSGHEQHNIFWADVITIAGDECVLTMSLDVTEQRRAAQQQKALEEQLRQAQKLEALGTLAGGIAHDFNNILGGIISYSELSKLENPENGILQENLDEILRASERATALVRQILSFSRRQKEERKNLQLAPIIKEALSLLRATLPSTIALHQQIDGPLPDVLANPTQVHQIIMNLFTNAAHAMNGKQGQVSIELGESRITDDAPKPHVELRSGDYVRLTISDTGHGMDAATAGRIFEPFFTTKGSGEGTGLGLSVVHGIVKEYGGVVTVDSELGRGTSLSIYLPARAVTEPLAPIVATDILRGSGQRVLFVDDEPVLGDVAKKMMQRLGYQALVFQSSEAAWAAFQKDPNAFDALITDLTMPALTGVDLARQVLRLRPSLPIILVSGSSGPLTSRELREMGIRELLSKPLDYRTLAQVLHQLFLN